MYADPNFKTKKALKEALKGGCDVYPFNPGLGGKVEDGIRWVEGPHAPLPHRWYAKVLVKDGRITEVLE